MVLRLVLKVYVKRNGGINIVVFVFKKELEICDKLLT